MILLNLVKLLLMTESVTSHICYSIYFGRQALCLLLIVFHFIYSPSLYQVLCRYYFMNGYVQHFSYFRNRVYI